jgi:hypothetical protein
VRETASNPAFPTKSLAMHKPHREAAVVRSMTLEVRHIADYERLSSAVITVQFSDGSSQFELHLLRIDGSLGAFWAVVDRDGCAIAEVGQA